MAYWRSAITTQVRIFVDWVSELIQQDPIFQEDPIFQAR
jgi:hypothetical protein